MSGLFTVNSASTASGNNYQSLTSIISDLNAKGINGAVTISVVPNTGPYTGGVIFNNIPGLSQKNTITLLGNGNTMTNGGTQVILNFMNSSFIQIQNLNVIQTSIMPVLQLMSAASHNTFSACNFVQAQNSASNIYFNGPDISYNSIVNCTVTSGYYGINLYSGQQSNPVVHDNIIENCLIRNFGSYGLYVYDQATRLSIRNNTVTVPNLPYGSTFKYAILLNSPNDCVIENNKIHQFIDGPSFNTSVYGIYLQSQTAFSSTGFEYTNPGQNIIRNNLITDIAIKNSITGIYVNETRAQIYNNTISLDDTTYTGTQPVEGIRVAGGHPAYVVNNIVTIKTKGNRISRCAGLSTSSGQPDIIDYNDFVNASPAGTVALGTIGNTNCTNLAGLQSFGFMLHGFNIAPLYANPAQLDYHPSNLLLNNQGLPLGLKEDSDGEMRDLNSPDPGALEFNGTPCSSTPAITGIAGSGAVCKNKFAELSPLLLNLNSGLKIQWYSMSSATAVPLPIAGATNFVYKTPLVLDSTYYKVVVTCPTASAGNSYSALVLPMPEVITRPPFHEGFENISQPNDLPNCSWYDNSAAPYSNNTIFTYTAATVSNRVPRTGNGFATFQNCTGYSGTIFTNKILFYPGYTYSATAWYQATPTPSLAWITLSMYLCSQQTTSANVNTINVNTLIKNTTYQPITNTLSVASASACYLALTAVATTVQSILTWDDLEITLPCQLPGNSPQITITPSTTMACTGQPLSLTCSGAHTYTWDNGATGASLVDKPTISSSYTVYATDTISGCISMKSLALPLYPAPTLLAFVTPSAVCAGKNVTVQCIGAQQYVWNNGSQLPFVLDIPTANTSYTVIGTGKNGCTAKATTSVLVSQAPSIQIISNKDTICSGDQLSLKAVGALSYTWITSDLNSYKTDNIQIKPVATGAQTVQGTNIDGCLSTKLFYVVVNECTGLSGTEEKTGIKVFPNPTKQTVNIISSDAIQTITVKDAAGRVIWELKPGSLETTVSIDIAGLYFVTVSGSSYQQNFRLIVEP